MGTNQEMKNVLTEITCEAPVPERRCPVQGSRAAHADSARRPVNEYWLHIWDCVEAYYLKSNIKDGGRDRPARRE